MQLRTVKGRKEFIEVLKLEIKKLEQKNKMEVSRKRFKCLHCSSHLKFRDLIKRIDEYYVQPYSCTGGDYYTTSDEKSFYCPQCGVLHRLLSPASKERFKELYEFDVFGRKITTSEGRYELTSGTFTEEELRKIKIDRFINL